MVFRRSDPIDRRVKRVFLTKDGRKLVSQNKELDRTVNDTTLKGVSEADFEVTMRTLDTMKANLLATLEGSGSDDKTAPPSTVEGRAKASARS